MQSLVLAFFIRHIGVVVTDGDKLTELSDLDL